MCGIYGIADVIVQIIEGKPGNFQDIELSRVCMFFDF